MSFNDIEFANSVATKISSMFQPSSQQTITASVTAAVETIRRTVLEEILASNLHLTYTVDGQIQDHKVLIETQSKEIDSNKRRIDELEGENHFLKSCTQYKRHAYRCDRAYRFFFVE